jgi:hypothetical protein
MQRRLLRHDREAEAGAGCAARGRADERLEHAVAVGRVHAGPVVLDAQEEMAVVAREADVDLAAAVQGRVVEPVVDEQAQAVRPAANARRCERLVELLARGRVPAAGGVDGGVDHLPREDVELDEMQTGTSTPSARRRRTTATPSRSGIVTSSTMTAGGFFATAASAALPPAAVSTAKPSSASARSRACRTGASSSTTRTSGSAVVATGASSRTGARSRPARP